MISGVKYEKRCNIVASFLDVKGNTTKGLPARGVGGGGVNVCVFFISCPHTGTKCTSGLFSCVQGSVTCSLKPRKLQSSQAENRRGIWTTGLTCLRAEAHKATSTVNEDHVQVLYITAQCAFGNVEGIM